MKTVKLNKTNLKYLNEEVLNDKNLLSKENENALIVLSYLAFKETLRLQRTTKEVEETIDYIYPTTKEICNNTNIKTPRLVTEAIADLQIMGYIIKLIQGKKGVANRYYLKQGITKINILDSNVEFFEERSAQPSVIEELKQTLEIALAEIESLKAEVASLKEGMMVLQKNNKAINSNLISLRDTINPKPIENTSNSSGNTPKINDNPSNDSLPIQESETRSEGIKIDIDVETFQSRITNDRFDDMDLFDSMTLDELYQEEAYRMKQNWKRYDLLDKYIARKEEEQNNKQSVPEPIETN